MQTKTINIIVGALAVLAVIFGVSYLKPPKVEVAVNVPEQSQRPSLGAVSTLDAVDNPYVSISGKEEYHLSLPILATSSTYCSVLNPFAPATTSITSVGTRILGTILGATTYDISTSTTLYGSSTPALAYAHSVAANSRNSFKWFPKATTTPYGNVRSDQVLMISDAADPEYPYFLTGTQRLNWRIATSTPGTDYYEGRCFASFEKY